MMNKTKLDYAACYGNGINPAFIFAPL